MSQAEWVEELPQVYSQQNKNYCILRIIYRGREYIKIGATKFVMFPIVDSWKDMVKQTQYIVEEVIPRVEN